MTRKRPTALLTLLAALALPAAPSAATADICVIIRIDGVVTTLGMGDCTPDADTFCEDVIASPPMLVVTVCLPVPIDGDAQPNTAR